MDIYWFKRDLRIQDNSALYEASKQKCILPLYIFEPELWKQQDHSYRHYAFLVEALTSLSHEMETTNSNLNILVGDAVGIFDKLCKVYNVERIWSQQETWNLWTYNRDKAVASWAKKNKVKWLQKPKNGIVRNLDNRDGWSRSWYSVMSAPIVPLPDKINSIKIVSDNIPNATRLNLDINQPAGSQRATRTDALSTLATFLSSRGSNYTFEMSSPNTAEESCSRISPYLAFGQISVREAFQITEKRAKELRGIDTKFSKSLKSFSSRLRWHCHFIQKLEDQPSI